MRTGNAKTIKRQWSALRGISDQCHDFDWETLIGIGHWLRESCSVFAILGFEIYPSFWISHTSEMIRSIFPTRWMSRPCTTWRCSIPNYGGCTWTSSVEVGKITRPNVYIIWDLMCCTGFSMAVDNRAAYWSSSYTTDQTSSARSAIIPRYNIWLSLFQTVISVYKRLLLEGDTHLCIQMRYFC